MIIAECYDELSPDIKQKLEEANVFYSEPYGSYVSEIKGAAALYVYDNSGILMLELYKKNIFKYVLLPSEVFFWGETEDTHFIEDALSCVRKKYHPDWIGPSAVTAVMQNIPPKAVSIPWGTYRLSLNEEPEEIWGKIHSKHRNVIRRAEKEAVYLKQGEELLDDYLKLDKQTWERSGRPPIPESLYRNMMKFLKGNIRIYIAYKDEIPQGGAIFLYNNNTCYYMYGASRNEPVLGAMNWLHWQVIQEMKKLGVRNYDFVGCRINVDQNSKYQGIQRFKERFGGELVTGKMFKSIYNPTKYLLYKKMKSIKNGGKAQRDIIEQEISKWE